MKMINGWWMPDLTAENKGIPLVMGMTSFYLMGKPLYQYHKYVRAAFFCKQKRVAVDIGAHVGCWAWVLASEFEHVHAFEPLVENFDCLLKNLEVPFAEKITAYPMALGDFAGSCSMRVKSSNTAVAHVLPTDGPLTSGDLRQVKQETLDRCALQGPIDFIKMDCEGFETFVIRGGEATIRQNCPVIIVEQKPDTKDRYGLKFRSAVDLLQSWGAYYECEIGGDHILHW